jgi:predicted RNA-binding protein with PUA-like domain
MAYFLAKTDPQEYSIDNLAHDQKTTWDGVRNAQALRAIRTMKPGDDVLIYHSGGESALIGLARVTSDPRPNEHDDKSWVVDIEYVRRLVQPVTLHEIKETHQFDDWSLVRQSRLSTMEVPDTFVHWLREHKVL